MEQRIFKTDILIPLLQKYKGEEIYNNYPQIIEQFRILYKKPNATKLQILKYLRDIKHLEKDSQTKINNSVVIKEKQIKKTTTKDNTTLNIVETTEENIKIDKIVAIKFESPLSQRTIRVAEKTLQKCNYYIDNFDTSKVIEAKNNLISFYNTYLDPIMNKIKAGERVSIPSEQMKIYDWMENKVTSALKHIERAEKSELYILSTIQEVIFNTEKAVNGSIANNKTMIEEGNIQIEKSKLDKNDSQISLDTMKVINTFINQSE